MRVLIGCEESGTVRDAFIARGHRVLSCDLEPTRSPGPHYRGDIFDVIDYPWDLAIFHPPCTHTSVSGAKHFAEKWGDGRQACAVAFFMQLWRRAEHIRRVAFEQPVSVISSLFRKPDQIIQPWQFGHGETKATCLWLRGLPPPETDCGCRGASRAGSSHGTGAGSRTRAQQDLQRHCRSLRRSMGHRMTLLLTLLLSAASAYTVQYPGGSCQPTRLCHVLTCAASGARYAGGVVTVGECREDVIKTAGFEP